MDSLYKLVKNNPKISLDTFEDACRDEIMRRGFSKGQSKTIYNRSWADGHSAGLEEVVGYIVDNCSFAREILDFAR